jgi:hypothetical protein
MYVSFVRFVFEVSRLVLDMLFVIMVSFFFSSSGPFSRLIFLGKVAFFFSYQGMFLSERLIFSFSFYPFFFSIFSA